MTRTVLLLLTVAAVGFAPASSRRHGAPRPAEVFEYSVGPCMGFCPVYQARITPRGAVSFRGERHTAVLGKRDGRVGASGYRDLLRALAPYRPATGATARTHCDGMVSDLQTYRITWTRPDGRKTTLEHDRGCRSARNDRLNLVIDRLPERLGITDWARQITRAGAGRG